MGRGGGLDKPAAGCCRLRDQPSGLQMCLAVQELEVVEGVRAVLQQKISEAYDQLR